MQNYTESTYKEIISDLILYFNGVNVPCNDIQRINGQCLQDREGGGHRRLQRVIGLSESSDSIIRNMCKATLTVSEIHCWAFPLKV